jgi:alpha-L-fucosidase 2
MHSRYLLSLFIFLLSNSLIAQPLKLWYKQPARNWNEALPVGNGRLGVMVFGRENEELLQLNESTLWSGGPVNPNPNPEAKTYLPQIRKALADENYELATSLTQKMQGRYTESYEPLGDLVIRHSFSGKPSNYYRDLNISDAVATTRFSVDGVTYSRDIFVSAPDQIIVIRLTADKPGKLNFTASAKSSLRHQNVAISSREIGFNGKAPSHTDPNYVDYNPQPVIYDDASQCRGMRFAMRMRALPSDGTVTADTSGLRVSNATSIVLLISAATSFNGFDKCPDKDGKDEIKLVNNYLNAAARKSYTALKQAHETDFHSFFNRVSLTLNDNKDVALPTDERLMSYASGTIDPALESLYYQFGRYLLISSSRPNGTAANLQGIWNPHVRPPWSSNYTININTQMNYWPAEVSNLSEFHQPLFSLISNVSKTGYATSRDFYGTGGWTAHHNTDIWAESNPVGDLGKGSPLWANWALGGAWLSQHLYEHYRFTGDRKFLQETAYPLMKGAAQFCSDWLVPDKNGYLVTAPSTTPENVFVLPNGKKGEVSVATTMDMSIIRDLFTNVIEASTVLNTDADFRKQISDKTSKLYPFKIGKKANLQEWYQDFDDVDPQHRHVSHLFALHPGRQIAPLTTPDLAAAARKTLDTRGDGGTGWSKAWKINFWARLNDGDHAYKLLRELLRISGVEGTNYANAGGTYPNLFCAHPPFQIDGNFGGIAGMSEMLIQSHLDDIYLLAALPSQWQSGQVKGLRTRGGFDIVEMDWRDGKVNKVVIQSTIGGNCRIRVPNSLKALGNVALKPASGANPNSLFQGPTTSNAQSATQVYDFMTKAGQSYTLTMQ